MNSERPERPDDWTVQQRLRAAIQHEPPGSYGRKLAEQNLAQHIALFGLAAVPVSTEGPEKP